MMTTRGREQRERGIALVLVMTVVLALAIIATPFVLSMLLQERSGTLSRYESQADYGAEGAKNYALWRLMYSLDPIERRYPTPTCNTYFWDGAREFDIRLDDATLANNARTRDPKGAIWGLTVEDEQGKINVKSAPSNPNTDPVRNVQTMIDSRVVSLKDYLTLYSGRDASWVCPQRIRGMGNVLPAQQYWIGQSGVYVDRPEVFGIHAKVRITKPGNQPLESRVVSNWTVDPGTNGITTDPSVPPSYADGVIEVEYRHPVNVNTARRETLIAMFEKVSLWDPKNQQIVPGSEIGRGDAVRLANAFHGKDIQRLEQFGLALAQTGLAPQQLAAVALNAVCPTAALLHGSGTVPICFKSYDVYTIEAAASMNNPSGAEVAGRGFREVVSVAAPTILKRYVESQLDFDLMLQPLAVAAPQNFTGYIGGGYPYGGRVATFPMMIPNALPVNTASGEPIGPSDTTLKPQPTGKEAYVQLFSARDTRGLSTLGYQLKNWKNQDPRDHFDDSQEGKHLRGASITYPWDQVFTQNYDLNSNPPPGPLSQTPDVAGGGIELWARFDSTALPIQIFDIQEQPYTNRVNLRIESGASGPELVFTVCDSTIGGMDTDAAHIDSGAAEVRQSFAPVKDTWYHFGAYWKGTRYAQLALLVDGFPHPTQKFNHINYNGKKAMTTLGQDLAQNATSIALKDDTFIPGYLTPLRIGDEIVVYDKSAGVLLRGARGTQAVAHKQGATVSLWGYSSKVRGMPGGRPSAVQVTFPNQGNETVPYDRISKGGATLQYHVGINPQATLSGEKQDMTTMMWYIDSTDTTIGVVSPDITQFPDQGYITIEDEVIFYTGRVQQGTGKGLPPSTAKFTGCTRGLQGTTPARHDAPKPVRMWCIPVTNFNNYQEPTILQIGDEWFGPVWKDKTKANFWIVKLDPTGKPYPLRRGNQVFGSIPGDHNPADKIIPTFLSMDSDQQARQYQVQVAPANAKRTWLNMGRNDYVTVVDASNGKEEARVRSSGGSGGDYNLQGADQIAAFFDFVSKDYIADDLYVRVMKFPSGELLGLQWLTTSNPNASVGPADVTIDEVKSHAQHKTYLANLNEILSSNNSLVANRQLPWYDLFNDQSVVIKPHLLKIGDEYIGFNMNAPKTGNVTGLKRGWLNSTADLHDQGDLVFSLNFIPVTTLSGDITAADANLALVDPLCGHPNRYRNGYVLVDNEVMLFEWNGSDGRSNPINLGMPVRWDGTTGLYRGMFGTTAASHSATTSLVYGIPYRYYDTYKAQEYDDTMAYFQWSTKMDLTNWRTFAWTPDPQFNDPNVVVHGLVRYDGKGEFFDRPGITDKVLLQEFITPKGNTLNRVGHMNDAGQLDVRFYVEYKAGSFDATQPWAVHSWKKTPKIKEIQVEYDRPLQTLYHEDR